jgi:hypothetical protein
MACKTPEGPRIGCSPLCFRGRKHSRITGLATRLRIAGKVCGNADIQTGSWLVG